MLRHSFYIAEAEKRTAPFPACAAVPPRRSGYFFLTKPNKYCTIERQRRCSENCSPSARNGVHISSESAFTFVGILTNHVSCRQTRDCAHRFSSSRYSAVSETKFRDRAHISIDDSHPLQVTKPRRQLTSSWQRRFLTRVWTSPRHESNPDCYKEIHWPLAKVCGGRRSRNCMTEAVENGATLRCTAPSLLLI